MLILANEVVLNEESFSRKRSDWFGHMPLDISVRNRSLVWKMSANDTKILKIMNSGENKQLLESPMDRLTSGSKVTKCIFE